MTFWHVALAAAAGVWGAMAGLVLLGLTAAAIYGESHRRRYERPERREVPHA